MLRNCANRPFYRFGFNAMTFTDPQLHRRGGDIIGRDSTPLLTFVVIGGDSRARDRLRRIRTPPAHIDREFTADEWGLTLGARCRRAMRSVSPPTIADRVRGAIRLNVDISWAPSRINVAGSRAAEATFPRCGSRDATGNCEGVAIDPAMCRLCDRAGRADCSWGIPARANRALLIHRP